MNVLSLFDGMSCGQIALERAGIKVDNYYASEIDKYAIAVTQHNYPNTIQLGDVNNFNEWDLPDIDLIMGGSPCQGFSFAGKQLNFNDSRSKLFFKFVDALKKLKPKYFLLENVRMRKEYQDIISNYLGVEPININSSLLTAQNRERLYWTNIPNITQPEDKGMLLGDIVESNSEDHYYLSKKQIEKVKYLKGSKAINRDSNGFKYIYREGAIRFPNDLKGKSNCLTASGQSTSRGTIYIKDEKGIRKLMPIECERLQTVPDNYTLVPFKNRMMSNLRRYKMLGNGWTVDVISHIFSKI